MNQELQALRLREREAQICFDREIGNKGLAGALFGMVAGGVCGSAFGTLPMILGAIALAMLGVVVPMRPHKRELESAQRALRSAEGPAS